MVRLLGRISDKRLFFEDSKTILDHGSTAISNEGTDVTVHTVFNSVIWGWAQVRNAASVTFIMDTYRDHMTLDGGTLSAGQTVDWFAIGYTA